MSTKALTIWTFIVTSMSLLERSDSGDGVEACEPEAAA